MKKRFIFLLIFLLTVTLFGDEFTTKKVYEYQMGTPLSGLYLRRYEDIAPTDDISKNYLIFNTNGELCIYQADTSRMIYTDDFFEICKEVKMNLLISPYDCKFTDNNLLMSDKSGRIYLFDLQLNRKAYLETFNLFNTDNTGIWLAETYYDEVSDILFFRDTKNNLYSIIHPCLNDNENNKNCKTPGETLNLFNNDNTYFDTNHLSLYKNKYLVVDGIINYWGREHFGKYTYQIVNSYFVNLWDGKKSTPIKFDYIEGDEIESIAIHPSGDIYILRMNWQTNTHNLYYIENTWDLEWREQWYKEHPDAVIP